MDFSQTAVIRIEAKQLDKLFTVALLDSVIAAIGSTLLIVTAVIYELPTIALVTGAAPLLFAVARWLLALAYNRGSPPASAVPRWSLLFNLGAFASAFAWSGATAYFVFTDVMPAAAIAAGVGAVVSIAASVLYAGALLVTIVFAGIALLPAAALAAMRGDINGIVLCGSLAAAFFVTVICARVVKRLVWETVMAINEIEQLTGHLDQRRTQVEKLNVALKTNADKREQAEITLRRTSADLGLVQGKAKALADTLERVSPMCQVTGLANRRHFDEQLESEWRRATREQKPMSLVIVEMDEFEEYLDSYGRQSADALLKRVGLAMKGFGRRSGDLAGRYDEEKLAIMLPSCDARNAARMAEALRKRIEGTKIAHAGARNRDIMTVHIGVATIKPARSLPNAELQKRADAALYEARFQGGNKVVAYKPLSKLKLERWDQPADGPLSEQSLTQKLLVWGYDTAKDMLKPGEKPREHASEHDTVIAILTGEMLIDVEGHTMAVKSGDSVFVPQGVAIMLQAAGDKPVIKFTATKSK